jgi:hypothetical protein
MRQRLLLCGTLLLLVHNAHGGGERSPAFRFDAGPGSIPSERHAVRVHSQTRYTAERGYGFLTRTQTDYRDTTVERLSIGSVADGVMSTDSISFRIDTPPGRYVLEILMGGGRHTQWNGVIAVNGNPVAGPLRCSSTNTEAEGPPPFWGNLAAIQTDRPSLIITVRAVGQPTTIAGIACYPVVPGPVRFDNGRVMASGVLHSPNSDLLLRLINTGRVTEARRLVEAIPDRFALEKASLLFALASRMEIEDPIDLIVRGHSLLEDMMDFRPDPAAALSMRVAELLMTGSHFLRVGGWQWVRGTYGPYGLFDVNNIAGMCFGEASSLANHPLYPASLWLQGKAAYWLWVEQHDGPMIRLADSCFLTLKRWYPDHRLLTMYMGDTRFEIDDLPPPPGVPRWAFLQKTIMVTILDVIHYWVETRQAENGEFGGKYDDDVEMLRWWPVSRLVYNDSLALVGMKRLVDGIWKSGWIDKGYSKKVRDVEHASEPVADTQPMMIGFDYGNPVYVERCMESVKGIRDLWTGINAKGHRHFRSSWYSASVIDTVAPKDCDLAMNTRTVKAALWLAWYNRHPFVMKFLREWGDAWLEDCLRTDKGKPAGVVPAAIRFSDDAIGGHADNWHHPGMFWNYYDYNGGSAILQQLLLNTILLGDRKYLAPIERSLDLVRTHEKEDRNEAEVGSEKWAAKILQGSEGFWATVELWRLTTRDTTHDDLILRQGSPYLKFVLTGERSHLTSAMRGIANTLMRNIDLLKGEGYFTDRVELRDMRAGDSQVSSFLEAMLLGAPLNNVSYPFNRLSWMGFDTSVSAIVTRADPTAISATIFNHSRSPVTGFLSVNDLSPGDYRVTTGFDLNGDGSIDSTSGTRTFVVRERKHAVSLTLVPRTEQVVELCRIGGSEHVTPSSLPDLAVTLDDMAVIRQPAAGTRIVLPVHNIGTGPSDGCAYSLSRKGKGDAWEEIAKGRIPTIAPPIDLDPKIEQLTLVLPDDRPGTYLLRIDPENRVSELNESNNSITFRLVPR